MMRMITWALVSWRRLRQIFQFSLNVMNTRAPESLFQIEMCRNLQQQEVLIRCKGGVSVCFCVRCISESGINSVTVHGQMFSHQCVCFFQNREVCLWKRVFNQGERVICRPELWPLHHDISSPFGLSIRLGEEPAFIATSDALVGFQIQIKMHWWLVCKPPPPAKCDALILTKIESSV